jgi:hypothetical protein
VNLDWLSDAAQVATTIAAALAAGAAWASVRQGQRIWRSGLEPDLHPQILLNQRTGTTDLAILNAGGGVAKGAAFIITADGHRTSGNLLDGFVLPGERIYVATQLPHGDHSACVVMYRTADESSWAIDRVGPKRRLRRGRIGPGTTAETIWGMFYPDTSLDALTSVGHRARITPTGQPYYEWKRGARVSG